MLDDFEEFTTACREHSQAFDANKQNDFSVGDLYCPVCGGPRRVTVYVLYPLKHGGVFYNEGQEPQQLAKQIEPALFVMQCLQCHTLFTAVLFEGPPGVAYYLDQAQRSQNVGANSAAVAMHRSALEHLLHEQGYEMRMLGPKIAALEAGIKDGSAPRWARELNREYLTVIKRLGDAAIHPGEGDVDRQVALDNALLRQLRVTFSELLQVVYEREHEEKGRLHALRQALGAVEGTPTTSTEEDQQ